MIKRFKYKKFLHLVDHNGAIFSLISPLSSFKDHKVLTSFGKPFKETLKQIEKISADKGVMVILHATGNNKKFYSKKEEIFKIFKKNFLLLHVSPEHFIIKNRLKELYKIKSLMKKYKIKVLTPSRTLKKVFLRYGIKTRVVQVGLNLKTIKKNNLRDNKKIITVCTSEDEKYQYIKGMDLFIKLIKGLGLEKESIILGTHLKGFGKIKSRKVSKKDFLRYLKNSKVYIQLSRTESYNLSAIYAKRLKIPIIVSNIEGHKDNVKYGFRVCGIKEAEKILKKILENNNSSIKKVINKNYKDSIKRESLENFRNSLNSLLSL